MKKRKKNEISEVNQMSKQYQPIPNTLQNFTFNHNIGKSNKWRRKRVQRVLNNDAKGDKRQFAQVVGITLTRLTRFLNGSSELTQEHYVNISVEYMIDLRWLLFCGKYKRKPMAVLFYDAGLQKRIEQLIMLYSYGNIKEFCRRVSYNPQNMTHFLHGNNHRVPFQVLQRISYEFNVTMAWILNGSGQMFYEVRLTEKRHLPCLKCNQKTLRKGKQPYFTKTKLAYVCQNCGEKHVFPNLNLRDVSPYINLIAEGFTVRQLTQTFGFSRHTLEKLIFDKSQELYKLHSSYLPWLDAEVKNSWTNQELYNDQSLRNRIRQLVDIYTSGSVKKFGETVGYPPDRIRKYMKGQNNRISYVALMRMVKTFNISLDWLLDGEGYQNYLNNMPNKPLTKCIRCGADDIHYMGYYNHRQRYRCRKCKKTQYQDYNIGVSVDRHDEMIIKLLVEGVNFAGISRITGVSQDTVSKRIRTLATYITPPSLQLGNTYEVDEMVAHLLNKRAYWITTAYCRETKEIVGMAIGDRSKKTIELVINKLLIAKPKMIHTDKLATYRACIPKEIHNVTNFETNNIERNNAKLRNGLKCLARKSMSRVTKIESLVACVKIFLWRDQFDNALSNYKLRSEIEIDADQILSQYIYVKERS